MPNAGGYALLEEGELLLHMLLLLPQLLAATLHRALLLQGLLEVHTQVQEL